MGEPFLLRLGLFWNDEFVGWHFGDQLSATEFYMRNSAVLPEHRGKGLYSAMLRCVVELLVEMGFQEISSRHNTTNNAVIVPKLKQGFVITSLEVSDAFGVLVVLKYFANARRRTMMDVRSGMRFPEGEILEAMQRGRG
jgi:GNAT superfamily N-acetyltransferase